uniref:Small ribosomal subunit protein uS9c n=1 Tax=Halimeda discoidea TaxID=118222 RepID=A0A1C9JB71_9CHLO|nr:ribosomal protein S9 [Halimeda discoidea]
MINTMNMSYYGIGRRKSAVAQVFVVDGEPKVEDELKIQVNNLSLIHYFQNDQNAIQYIQNFCSTFNNNNDLNDLKVTVKVCGGGNTSQKEAIHLALARAFCKIDLNLKKPTQDCRIKERKKYGLKKARKAPQYSKR